MSNTTTISILGGLCFGFMCSITINFKHNRNLINIQGQEIADAYEEIENIYYELGQVYKLIDSKEKGDTDG